MINIESHLEKLGVSLTAQLVEAIQTKLIERKGASGNFQSVVNASGKLAKSIRYEVTNGTVLSFYGNDYILPKYSNLKLSCNGSNQSSP